MISGRSVLLYLATEIDAEKRADVNERLYQPLVAADPSALFLLIDDTPNSELNRLIWYIGENRWSGLLVIALPTGLVDDSTLDETYRPAFQWLVSVRKRTLAAQDFRVDPFVSALALARKNCERKGTVVLMMDSPRQRTSPLITHPPVERRFFTVHADNANRDLYQLLRSQHDYEFSTAMMATVADLGVARDSLPPDDPHNLNPFDIYAAQVQQELHNDSAAASFFDVLNLTFPEITKSGGNLPKLLPAAYQIALGVLRVCRCMSNWTLEGVPFDCTVVLIESRNSVGEHVHDLAPAFNIKNPFPLTFNDLHQLRKCAEIVQASDLFMTVDLEQGYLFQLSALHGTHANHSRHESFPLLTEHPGSRRILIHCRHGFVEVYAAGDLKLWFDGFRWRQRPFRALQEVLRRFFPSNMEFVRRYQAAVATLLDRQESSILVLTADSDLGLINEVARENMKAGIEPSVATQRNFSKNTDLKTIIGVLHLDGAHFIDQSGGLRAWARNASVGASEPEKPEPEASSKEGEHGGTGARASRWLSEKLPNSFVIKTSASGFVVIYRAGRQYLGPLQPDNTDELFL